MNTAPLPKEITDRIKKDAEVKNDTGFESILKQRKMGYIAGATSEAIRAQPLVQALEDAFKPYNLTSIGTIPFAFVSKLKEALTEYNKQP